MGDMLDVVQYYLLQRSFGEAEMLEAEDKARARITRLLSGESIEEEYGTSIEPVTRNTGEVPVQTEEGVLLTYPGLGPPLE